MKPSELRCCINLIAMYGKWKSDIGCRRSIGDLMRFLDPIEGWNCCKSTWFDLQSLRAIDRRPVAWWTLGDPGMRHCHVGNVAPFFCCCRCCCCCCCCCLFLWGLLEMLEDSCKFFEELLRLIHNDIMQLKMRDSWTNSFEGRRRDALKLFAISLSLSCRFSLKCDWIIRKGWWGDSRRDSFKDSSRDSTNRCWVMAQSRRCLLTYDAGRFCHSPINIHPISHS